MSEKRCEICHIEIPPDSGNLLCGEHYKQLVKAQVSPEAESVKEDLTLKEVEEKANEFGIADPNYLENPEAYDKEQWGTNIMQFDRSGYALWHPTRDMYAYIRDSFIDIVKAHPQFPKWAWKPNVIDVGSGAGIGANMLSQESSYVWGVDKNEKSVNFANQMYARKKNSMYYSPQLDFAHVDVMDEPREIMTFDVVVAIEIIEHVHDTPRFMDFLKRVAHKTKKGAYNTEDFKSTITYVSSPNRLCPEISNIQPGNKYHVRELTIPEMVVFLGKHYESVEPLSVKGVAVELDNTKSPILYRCMRPYDSQA